LHYLKISYKNILFVNLVSLSIALSSFIGGEGINVLLVGTMIFSVVICFSSLLKVNRNYLVLYLLPVTLLLAGLIHPSFFRLSSYLYGLLFVLFYIVNLNLLDKKLFELVDLVKILKYLIYSYFLVLVVQQAMYLVGVSNFLNKIFATGFKFNSLATEPSYSVTIVALLFNFFIRIKEKVNGRKLDFLDVKKDGTIWFSFVYFMLLTGSTYGIFLLLLFLLSFIKKAKYIIMIGCFIFLIIYVSIAVNFTPAVRLLAVFNAFSFNEKNYLALVAADHSASIRILPPILLLGHLDYYTFFGKGAGYSGVIIPKLIPGIEAGTHGGGILPAFIVDQGLLNSFILVLIFRKYVVTKILSFEFLLLFFSMLNTSFNAQLFWCLITFLTIQKRLQLDTKTPTI
jgi:hypothetical protein